MAWYHRVGHGSEISRNLEHCNQSLGCIVLLVSLTDVECAVCCTFDVWYFIVYIMIHIKMNKRSAVCHELHVFIIFLKKKQENTCEISDRKINND